MKRYLLFTLLAAAALAAQAVRPDKEQTSTSAPSAATEAGAASLTAIPPLPPGVAELKFGELFQPIGRRGLELTGKVKSLDGRRVRILGYMVRQCDAPPGLLLIAPRPVTLHTREYGLADDLPPSALHVCLTGPDSERPPPYTPGLLLLTGTLSVGSREELDGRVSVVRLVVDPPGRDAKPNILAHSSTPTPFAPRRQACCSNEETNSPGREAKAYPRIPSVGPRPSERPPGAERR